MHTNVLDFTDAHKRKKALETARNLRTKSEAETDPALKITVGIIIEALEMLASAKRE
jgi:hypothetical protein